MPSYVSLLSCNASDPVCFVLMEKKGQATEKLQDWYGHVIVAGELYLEGRYLHKSRSRHPNKKKFNVLDLFILALVKFLKHLLSLMMI